MPAPITRSKAPPQAAVICCPNVPRSPIIGNNLYSLGLLYLANSCAKTGFGCELIDAYFLNLGTAETARKMLACKSPAAYGFMINSEEMLSSALEIVRNMKQCRPRSKFQPIVLGGMYATLRYRSILARHPEVDFVVLGEGELTFTELLTALQAGSDMAGIKGLAYRKRGKIHRSPGRELPECLDSYGHYDLLRIPGLEKSNAWTISSSRGCSGSCSFCLVGLNFLGKSHWRGHSAGWISEQLRALVRQHGVRRVLFVDDEFIGCPASLARGEQLARRLIKMRLSVKYSIMCRPDTVIRNKPLLRLLRDSGLETVFLGVETFDDRILKSLNKGFKSADSKSAITFLESLGILVQCGNIVFTPWMTAATLARDLRLFREQVENNRNTVFFSLNGIDIFAPTALGQSCSAGEDAWQLHWPHIEKKMYSVYQLWLEIERAIFFPALGGLAGKQSEIRKQLCLWQIDTVMEIIEGVTEKRPGLRRKLLFGAYLRACDLVGRHGGGGALKRFISLNRDAAAPAAEKEICFERHY